MTDTSDGKERLGGWVAAAGQATCLLFPSHVQMLQFRWGMNVYVQNRSERSSGVLHHYQLTKGFKLTSQYYSPSSVVYVQEPIRAIKKYLALIKMQSVVSTSSQFIQKKYSIMNWSFILLISSGICSAHQPTLIWFCLISAHAILWCLIFIWPKSTQFRPDWLCRLGYQQNNFILQFCPTYNLPIWLHIKSTDFPLMFS